MNPLNLIVPAIAGAALLGATEANASPVIDYGTYDPSAIIDYGPDLSGNLRAFLSLIREGESNGDYRALVGGGSFSDFSHHPGWTGADMTVKSNWAGWRNSHAAGAYQFQPQTFKEMSDLHGLNGDFGPDAQDTAAIGLLHRRGAYDDVINGNFESAVEKLRNEWAFFNDWDYGRAVAYFQNAGGYIA